MILIACQGKANDFTGRAQYEYPHIGLHEGSTLQHFLNRVVSDTGEHLNLRIQLRGFDAMCRMVESNVGIGFLPQSAGLRHSQSMKLALVELRDPWAVRERSVIVQKLETLPADARELVEYIRGSQVDASQASAYAVGSEARRFLDAMKWPRACAIRKNQPPIITRVSKVSSEASRP